MVVAQQLTMDAYRFYASHGELNLHDVHPTPALNLGRFLHDKHASRYLYNFATVAFV
jgi:hypothetical protein